MITQRPSNESEAPPRDLRPIPIVNLLNHLVRRIAETTAWLNLLLIGIILIQVVLRYGFSHGLVPLEELMWHCYAVAFMFGIPYAITNDSHIRVDLVHMRLPRSARHMIEIFGILLLLMPFLWIVFHHSLDWVADAYRVGESSTSPQGLPYRWLIKAVIPVSVALIFLAAFARLIQETLLLFGQGQEPSDEGSGKAGILRRLFQPRATRSGED